MPRHAIAIGLSGLLFLCPVVCSIGSATATAAEGADPAVAAILSSAESLFRAIKAGDNRATWALITGKSRATIVEETSKALSEAVPSGNGRGALPTREEISRDFAKGGPIARNYWEGFLKRFDPDEALKRSRWEIGTIDRDTAVVVLTHKDSDKPAVLKMFREGGGWKVGLVETFWTR